MTLATGTKLGAYEILAPIGAGGMGEVYRARDAKLGRDVAVKVLPASFARDAERMARFEREAKVLASLNQPNIAAIYGFEDSRHWDLRLRAVRDAPGKMALTGETVSETLAAVIRAEPDWPLLPTHTPLRVRVLLQRCLQRDARQRVRDIGDARIILDEVLLEAPELVSTTGASAAPASRSLWRRALPWVLFGASAIAGIVGWIVKSATRVAVAHDSEDGERESDQRISRTNYSALEPFAVLWRVSVHMLQESSNSSTE